MLYSLKVFEAADNVEQVIIVCGAENFEQCKSFTVAFPKIVAVEIGGVTRFASSQIGFAKALAHGATMVVLHNGCNPGITQSEIRDVIAAAKTAGAAGVARPVTSTLRQYSGGVILRDNLHAMETPQAIQVEVFTRGLQSISIEPTDDLQIAEAAGVIPALIPASSLNYKLTTPDDLLFFERMLVNLESRTGIGQDSHRFDEGGTLILGGIEIPSAPKLKGNSDGDAVLHALVNALSSTLGGGSLSTFSDELCAQGVTDSAAYLAVVLKRLADSGGHITNLSISIEAGKPKLETELPRMQQRIAELCSIDSEQIGITVTSGEKLTAVGQGEGIATLASVTVTLPKQR